MLFQDKKNYLLWLISSLYDLKYRVALADADIFIDGKGLLYIYVYI